jgi:hypothetical protein
VGPEAGFNVVLKRKVIALLGVKPQPSGSQSVTLLTYLFRTRNSVNEKENSGPEIFGFSHRSVTSLYFLGDDSMM